MGLKTKPLLLVMLTLLAVGGLFFARPLYRKIKSVRSRSISKTASDLFQKKQWQESFQLARAALQLNPDNLEALRLFARIYSVADQNRAYLYWNRVIEHPEAQVSDHQEFLEFLLRLSDVGKARERILHLLRYSPADVKTCRLAADYFLLTGNPQEARRWIQQAIQSAPEDLQLKMGMARVLLLSDQAEEHDQALQSLQEMTRGIGPEAVQAAELLIRNAPPDSAFFRHAERILSTHPLSTLREKLIAVEISIRHHPETKEKRVKEILQQHSAAKGNDREEIGRWLNRIGAHAQTIALMGNAPITSSTPATLLLIHLDALAALGQWPLIREILSRDDLKLEPVLTEIFRARTAMELRQDRQAEFHWSRVFALAGYDPAKLIFVGEYALKIGALDQSARIFQMLAKFPSYSINAYRNLVAIAERQGDLDRLVQVIRDLSRQIPEDPGPKNDLAYLQLLQQKNISESRIEAEALVNRHPSMPAFRITLALAHLRQQAPEKALRALDGITLDWSRAYPGWQAVYASVLAANGKKSEAKKIQALIQPARLKKEEKELLSSFLKH